MLVRDLSELYRATFKVLFFKGRMSIESLTTLSSELHAWLEEKEYQSIEQLKGSLSYQHAINP